MPLPTVFPWGADPNDAQSEVHIGVKGTPGLTCVLESSPGVETWTPEDSGTADLLTGLLSFDLPEPETTPRLFYRARLPRPDTVRNGYLISPGETPGSAPRPVAESDK